MRVLYDGVIYRIQKHGGVVRYFNGLIGHLPMSVDPVLLAPNRPHVAPENPRLQTYIETCGSLLWPIKPLRKRIIATRTYNRIMDVNPDVVHPTYYYSSMRNLTERVKAPTVLTVYDLIHERFPAQMDPYGKQIKLKQAAIRRADAIICISQSTKNDLQKYYSVPDDRIKVIHLGSDFPVHDIDPSYTGRPYFLFIGGRSFYKNFDRMLEAFSRVRQSLPEFCLKCVGGNPFSREERQRLKDLKLNGHVSWEGQLPDYEMSQVYSNAVALVYPSLYEGFGIPILEAMKCGTPVVTSNRASMPEVGGDAVGYFDPFSVDQMANAMEKVTDEETRRSMIFAGHGQARRFSWDSTIQEILEIYSDVSGIAARVAA